MPEADVAQMAEVLIGRADLEICGLEVRLRAAQLDADVAALDALLDEALLFTVPDGMLATKQQDLAAHGSGAVRFRKHVAEELRVRRVDADVAVVALRARLAVVVGGALVHGTYRYTRVCAQEGGGPWRVVGRHAGAVPGAANATP